MGVDTRAYIPGLTLDKLLEFMKVYDPEARLEEFELYRGEMYYIHFLDRMLTIHKVDLDMERAAEYARENGWREDETDQFLHVQQDGWPADTQGYSLKLGSDPKGRQVMRIITLAFGGYFKAEDTSAGQYKKMKKDRRKVIKVVFSDT